ncbi:diiron oxygenase [Pantoea ananatis]|uniref:diiron oxygenase n=1 Tax=Pantoea ananas TaxID=553 RepID=UPI00105AA8DC|nr:diiron oxygenase [Pantoea ananatis]TDL50790.1 hypothetical protein E2R52_17665 [Pantoea ananatis]
MNIENIFKRQFRHEELWPDNAAVTEHRETLLQIDGMQYQPEYDDFVKEYLPFYSEHHWESIESESRKLLLSFGWFMYNQKTIIIEQSALTEYCKLVLSGNSSFSFTRNFITRLAQVQVDETYHTLMSYKGIDLCQRLSEHNLSIFPDTDLALYIHSLQALPVAEKELAWLALTTVCEATISKYLSVLPGEDSVQPAFRFITEMHRQDEASHSSLFLDLMAVAFDELDMEMRIKLTTHLNQAVRALVSSDRKTWSFLYQLAGVVCPEVENPLYSHLYNFRMIKKFTGEYDVRY